MGFKSRVDGEVTKRPFGLSQIHPRDESNQSGSLLYNVLSQPLPERGRRHLVEKYCTSQSQKNWSRIRPPRTRPVENEPLLSTVRE